METETYLEPCQTSTMKLFYNNSYKQKAPSIEIFERDLNTPLEGLHSASQYFVKAS